MQRTRTLPNHQIQQHLKAVVIEKSLTDYLQNQFPNGGAWQHPITGEVYSATEVKQGYQNLIKAEPDAIAPLRYIFTGIAQIVIAERTGQTSSTVRRHIHNYIPKLLLHIMHKELCDVS